MKTIIKYDPVQIMRQFLFVREAGANKGQRVEAIQRWCGGVPGESYCCYAVTMVLDICFQGFSPIKRMGVCQSVYDLAKKNNWILPENISPESGDVFLYVNDVDHAHHIGFVTDPGSGIAGNTSADGKSSNGDGFHEHAISQNRKTVKFVRYPKSFESDSIF